MKKNSLKNNLSVFTVSVWVVICLWAVIFLFMLGWGIVQSFKDVAGFWFDPVGFPKKEYGGWKFSNYTMLWQKFRVKTSAGWVYLPEMLMNTLIYCIFYGFLSLIGPIVTSYIYTKYSKRVKWAKIVWVLVLINMYVPLSASLSASIELSMRLGYYNNIWLFAICSLYGFGGCFLIYYAVWKGLSWDYAEAAFIDGAGHFRVFISIMLPMTGTVFGVLFITAVIGNWSDYTTPMIYLPSYPTLALGVFRLQTSVEPGMTGVPVKLAGLLVCALPMFILFMAFREKIMTSLTIGGLKG